MITRQAAISCYVAGSMCQQFLRVEVAIPETYEAKAIDALAVAQARALAAIWGVEPTDIQVDITIKRNDIHVESYYDLSMRKVG